MTKRMIQIAILATALASGAALSQAATASAQQNGGNGQPPAAALESARPEVRIFEDVNIEKAVLGQYDPLKRRIERLRDLKTAEALDHAKDSDAGGRTVE